MGGCCTPPAVDTWAPRNLALRTASVPAARCRSASFPLHFTELWQSARALIGGIMRAVEQETD